MRFGALVDPNWPITEPFVADVRVAASAVMTQVDVLSISSRSELDTVFANLAQTPIDALLVGPAPLLYNRRVQLATLAAYHRVPAIFQQREFAEAGGLMSYGTSLTDANRQAGVYTGRILKERSPPTYRSCSRSNLSS
jgi:putative ABC transport system substrate-binding protein